MQMLLALFAVLLSVAASAMHAHAHAHTHTYGRCVRFLRLSSLTSIQHITLHAYTDLTRTYINFYIRDQSTSSYVYTTIT